MNPSQEEFNLSLRVLTWFLRKLRREWLLKRRELLLFAFAFDVSSSRCIYTSSDLSICISYSSLLHILRLRDTYCSLSKLKKKKMNCKLISERNGILLLLVFMPLHCWTQQTYSQYYARGESQMRLCHIIIIHKWILTYMWCYVNISYKENDKQ